MKLAELSIGSRAILHSFAASAKPFRQKLLALGLTPGTMIELTRRAPLGDPLEIKVRGFHLSIRNSEAMQVMVMLSQTAMDENNV